MFNLVLCLYSISAFLARRKPSRLTLPETPLTIRHKIHGSEYWTNLNLKRNWIQTKILYAERSEFIFYWTKKNADKNFQKLWLNGIFNDNFWQPFRQLQLDFDKKLLNRILPDKMRSETYATEKILKNGGLTSSKLTNRLWKICGTEYWKKNWALSKK